MCGFAGFWDLKRRTPGHRLTKLAGRMAEPLAHRGPDALGAWADEAAGVGLGHRRLAVIDLSKAAHQPMVSASGRLVLAYNGEVYNFREIRAELQAQGRHFRSESDTEVVLEACEVWGVEGAARRFVGMFAFALWDRSGRHLYLVRDRLGIKPLYWGLQDGLLLFGSQPKSFFGHPLWRAEVDRDALAAYFRFNYVPTPLSIYKGVRKLAPGHIVTVSADGSTEETCYWDISDVVRRSLAERTQMSVRDARARLEDLLADAAGRRMIADVPVGAFLSGGVDSSAVVALMQAQSDRPVQSFSIGFHESDYDEAAHAKAVAAHLGTDHHELYLRSEDALAIIPTIADWCDEPFADSSAIPTFLVSRLARGRVTVALTGDGGDEVFAGYNRYLWGSAVWRHVGRLPRSLRRLAATVIASVPPGGWDRLAALAPPRSRPVQVGDKAQKLADLLCATDAGDVYRRLVSLWNDPDEVVVGGAEPRDDRWGGQTAIPGADLIQRMQYSDTVSALPDDMLTKVDRASMAVGLEVRVPLLDHRIVEFAWGLPTDMKVRDGTGKWLLRQVLYRYVPKELVERPKMGFGVPIDAWLRGPLREWAEGLLSPSRLRAEGYLNPAPVRRRWEEHLSGRRNWQHSLWGVLMFQTWKERWLGR
jgi:asparagine synthase (glutamine-hydrolysing)